MALQYQVRNPSIVGPPTTLDYDRVRTYTLQVTSNAEEGSVGASSIVVDDPNGTFDIVGHRDFAIRESAVTSGHSYIFVGATAERRIRRGSESGKTGTGREWEISLVDLNTFLQRRVMVGTDNNRPAETDVARIQWLLTTAEGAFIQDSRYFSTTGPVAMDACDYRGQTFQSVLDDCAQQSGKNYFVTTFEDTGTTVFPWGIASLWYDFTSSTAYTSTIALSNDLADVDSITTFAISQENTTLTRDPSRVFSSVYMPYDGGTAYVNHNVTALAFARRDAVSPAENVKTAAKAEARANRYLNDIDTEEDVIETEFQVPAASVNLLREGMRVPVKATHLPGYETAQYMRVLNRTVKQDSELTYTISCELASTGTAVPTAHDVQWISMTMYGNTGLEWASIQGSDDGSSWTTVVPDMSTGYYAGTSLLWQITNPAHQAFRYWSIYYTVAFPGGFFSGFTAKAIRLMDGSGNDALNTQGTYPGSGPAIPWALYSPLVMIGPSIPYSVTSVLATVAGTYHNVDFTGVSSGQGDYTLQSPASDPHFHQDGGVFGAGTVTTRWVWDLGA